MEFKVGPREILSFDDAKIVFRNFEGRGDKYNREGDRNFAVVIPNRDLTMEEVESILDIYREAELIEDKKGKVLMYDDKEIISIVDALSAFGWNVKIRDQRDGDDEPFIYLPVKIKFTDRGPNVYLKTGEKMNQLDEESIDVLDNVDIAQVDLDIRPYDWILQEGTPNEKRGRAAYLQSMCVTQNIDRFAARYAGN